MKSIKLAGAAALLIAALGTTASADGLGPEYGTPSPFPGYHPAVDAELRDSYTPPFKEVGPNTAARKVGYRQYYNNYTDYRPYVRGTYGSLACSDPHKGLRYQTVKTFWKGERQVLRCTMN